MPPPTSVPNLTPTEETNPESYVGYNYGLTYFDSTTEPPSNVATEFHFPTTLSLGTFAFSGIWDEHAEEATAGKDARLELGYLAKNVYLVMGGSGTVTVSAGTARRRGRFTSAACRRSIVSCTSTRPRVARW